MSPKVFKDWLCPVNLQSAKTPRSEQFCFCPSIDFLDSSVTANQSALISSLEHYMSSLKSFVSFMVMFFLIQNRMDIIIVTATVITLNIKS